MNPKQSTDRVRDPLSFLPGVAEKLHYYVYALIDPATNEVFYVGKGKGDRVYQHARHAKKVGPESRSSLKLDRIHEIHVAGHEVRVEILRHGIPTEEQAFEVEATVMDALDLVGLNLTNLASGHGTARGWRPLSDIVASYAATPAVIAPEHRVMLIRINREFRHGMTPEDLYEKTRQWWRVDKKRKAKHAFAVYDQVVRAVYRIDGWTPLPLDQQVGRMKGRSSFHGERDPMMDDTYLWTEVSSYLPRGARNAIRYVNC